MLNCEIVTLKTNNFKPYFEITWKDGSGDMTCLWIVELIKKLLGHNLEWENAVHYIVESFTRAPHYLAAVGLNNRDTVHSVFVPFNRLQEKLDLDMGFASPIPKLQVTLIPTDNMGYVHGFAPNTDMIPDQISNNGGDGAAAA